MTIAVEANASQFLESIPALGAFWPDCCDHTNYRDVPADWFCAVSDVVCSTGLVVERGGFTEINFIAAAGIVAAENACLPARPLITVFAGDGCLIVLPPEAREPVARALAGVQRLAERDYRLPLRIGMVRVAELNQRGAPLRVARLGRGQSIQSHLRGSGVQLADRLVKQDPSYAITVDGESAPDLSGLSCRWAPMRPRYGAMVSLLAQPMVTDLAESDRILQEIGALLERVLVPSPADHSPISAENLRFTWPPKNLDFEARSRPGPVWFNRLKLLLESGLAALVLRFDLRFGTFRADRYLRDLINNTDVMQMLDGLSMTIDCSLDQYQAIERGLEAMHRRGVLCYGLHPAESAQMTCRMFSLEEHHHFIDTTVGGYWQAARKLKQQLAARNDAGIT